MHITFPNADNYQVPLALFIACWKVWAKRFGDNHDTWRMDAMPIVASDQSLPDLIENGHRFSLEVMSRLLVPWPHRNKSQINREAFASVEALELDGEHARLRKSALEYWDSITFLAQDHWLAYAEARIQADIETDCDDPVVVDDGGVVLIGEDTYPPQVPAADASDDEFISALVRWIDDAPFQPMYRRQTVGEAVSGWHDRLLVFFWPKPRVTFPLLHAMLDPLLYRANELAKAIDRDEKWDQRWQDMAVKTAEEIFLLAGVPQRNVTLENVRGVIESALKADTNSTAKMNSGWTYLASLCTAHLEGKNGRMPQVIWNSRAAASVISRLDFLLVEAGVKSLGDRFPDIGSIPGFGGTRPRQYSLNWPVGYRKWCTQIAASELVNKMCDVLNNERKPNGERRYRAMPLPNGTKGPWTVRGVQLVLFSDGY